jgi:hypothetical protein
VPRRRYNNPYHHLMQLNSLPLAAPLRESLSAWLDKDEFGTLLEILASKAFAATADGAKLSVEAVEMTSVAPKAKMKFDEAAQLNACIEILKKLQQDAAKKSVPISLFTAEPTSTK